VVALLLLQLVLAGCVASTPAPRPADFPFHTAAPPVDIYWRLSQDPNRVRAEGLIERRQHHVGRAWLQLVGLDGAGRVVSFTASIWVGWRSESDLESFRITLRPRGTEQRFEVWLHDFEYPEEMGP
jgi:hypothetical protein